MNSIQKKRWSWKILVLLVLVLILNLPIISALEISKVRAEEITQNSAMVRWDTDQPADSFVGYGESKETLIKVGDAQKVTEHELPATTLKPSTKYYFKVESDSLVNDNSGELYSFTTLAPDTTPPEIVMELPEMVPGVNLDLVGWTEANSKVILYVNGNLAGSTIAIYTEQTNSAENLPADLSNEETEIKELPPIAQKYLQSGSQTKITPKIEEIAATITGKDDQEIAENIIQWIKSNLKNKDVDSIAKATLTAEEIIKKGEFSGCTDFALVFITLARAKNIPAIYVETIQEDFLGKVKSGVKIEGSFIGHVFADLYLNGEWVAVDPVGGYFTSVDSKCVNNKKFDGLNGCYFRKEQGQQISYLIYDKGIDFWSLGFKNKKEFTDKVYTENKALVGSAISSVYLETLSGKATSVKKVKSIETLNGKFEFLNIFLEKDIENQIKIEAIDPAGNKAEWSGKVFADSSKPVLTLEEIPEISDQTSLEIKGTISEKSAYEIFINEKSEAKGEGTEIKESINLKEGDNLIKISAKDAAGWEVVEEFSVSTDTQPPQVSFEIAKGNEFYQGRAESDLHGETEPGATVYLYVYRPLPYEYTPKFDRAWAKTTADKNGTFSFNEVDFESDPISLDTFAPKEVPSGLLQYSIFALPQVSEQQSFTYYVFVIAEDKSGKTGYAQSTVNLNTCYSADWDFDVQSIAQFQRPLKLDPGLLDDGREQITTVFNLSYRGKGYAKLDPATGVELEPAFKIQNVVFERACTQGMMEDDKFKVSCNIISQPKTIANNDQTAWYITYNLHSTEEFSDRKESFWNELKKRQLVFPLKLRISYQERGLDGNLGAAKTQSSCTDLGYYVDIPVDSKDMLPDFIADEGLDAVTWTIDRINEVMPYLEKAILVAGVSCITSFMVRMFTRYTRLVVSKLEFYFSKAQPDENKRCPAGQNALLMESTIDSWSKVADKIFIDADAASHPKIKYTEDWANKEKSLDKRCSMTASMWKAEAALDQAYKWTCDRVFCRAVPAGWTSSAEKNEVDTAILSQQQCTVSSRGVPLETIENCQEQVGKDSVVRVSDRAQELKQKGAFPCYRNTLNNQLYYIDEPAKGEVDQPRIVTLEWLSPLGGMSLDVAANAQGADLLAYKPAGSKDFILGTDQSCAYTCKNPRMQGYKADEEGGIQNYYNGKKDTYGCYREVRDSVTGDIQWAGKEGSATDKNNLLKGENKFAAGYTADCFVEIQEGGAQTEEIKIKPLTFGQSCTNAGDCKNETLGCYDNKCQLLGNPKPKKVIMVNPDPKTGATGLLQCVCTVDKEAKTTYYARTAAKEKDKVAEEWFYRENQVFKESKGVAGTYYPEWRYYSGRDFSSAFGADYLTDYLQPEGSKQIHQINPHTQFLGVYQTVCLAGVRAQLVTLRSILLGLKTCIEEAKITGLKDAGVCKTLFTQQVCGLMYKAIAYFFTGCSPYSFFDQAKKGTTLEGVGAVFDAGLGSIGEAMQSSIDDIQSDYGNAKLNQFFATGAKGFAQSICMAAFGYDWPLGMDFILDAAYAFPTKTTTMVFPAERELATFNPQKGTAIFNYNIGALVLPGCNIRSADVYLKCVGIEDSKAPGVQCGSQGCDCLKATQPGSALESEKIRYLDGGRLFDLKQGSMVDFKMPAPQKIDSNYRYDHVVVELKLDPYESADNCFDEGYRDGKFYFPIIDTSAPAELVCQVQFATGRYFCPEVQSMFGGGSGVYLEDPYLSCYDKNSQSWMSCDTPNIFTVGDQIRTKVHVFTDGGKYCIRNTVTGMTYGSGMSSGFGTNYGGQDLGIKQLPENIPGPSAFELPNLGTVTKEMFSGAVTTLTKSFNSDTGCSDPSMQGYPETTLGAMSFTFNYQIVSPGQYRVLVPVAQGVSVLNAPYTIAPNNYLTISGRDTLTPEEISKAVFNLNGLKATNLVGAPQGDKTSSCTYQVAPAAGQSYAQNQKTITVITELLLPDASGSCFNANIPVKAPAFGKPKHEAHITLLLEPISMQIASKMHQEFLNGNCNFVLNNANEIINRKKGDLEDALSLFYASACYALPENGLAANKQPICNLANIFFTRINQITLEKWEDYPQAVTKTGEYLKINNYLALISQAAGCNILLASAAATAGSTTASAGAVADSNAKCKAYNPDWSCQCESSASAGYDGAGTWDIADCTDLNECVTGKCFDSVNKYFCCANPVKSTS